jgi:DNA-binding LacI/PurR family transcriptional regulator
MADGLSAEARARILAELDRLAYDLNFAASQLEQAGAGACGDMLDRAAREIAACCWVLSEPLRKPSAA